MTNRYTGEVPLKIGEKEGVLQYPFGILAEVEAEYTKEQLEGLQGLNANDIARIAELGFKTHSSDITADYIKTCKPSPAKYTLVKAIDQALLYAYHGDEQATEILKKLDEMDAAAAGVDTTPPKKKATKKKAK